MSNTKFDQTIIGATSVNMLAQLIVKLNQRGILNLPDVVEILQATVDGSGSTQAKVQTKAVLKQLFPTIPLM